jgi:outer membrane protein assembly factor BamA
LPKVLDVARLTGTVARDTRDDPGDTTRGSLFSSNLEYAPEALGSDLWFARYLAQAYVFRPWRSVVFASAARLGALRALGGQVSILSERFLAGGARTVRGVAENSLGPRDFFGPTGGDAMMILNGEIRFPMYRWMRGVGFIDAGNVFAKPADISLTDLTGSIGAGLRFTTPVGVLRVDYGHRTWPELPASATSAQRRGRWIFGIGQAF